MAMYSCRKYSGGVYQEKSVALMLLFLKGEKKYVSFIL